MCSNRQRSTHLYRLERIEDLVWHEGLAHVSHPAESAKGLNGHDAGEDGDGEAVLPGILLPTDVRVRVVEELGHDKVGTCLLFLDEILCVAPLVARVAVAFRIPSDSDAKVVTVLAPDVPDQVSSVLELGVRGNPVLLPSRCIASKCEDVLDAYLFECLGCRAGARDRQKAR